MIWFTLTILWVLGCSFYLSLSLAAKRADLKAESMISK